MFITSGGGGVQSRDAVEKVRTPPVVSAASALTISMFINTQRRALSTQHSCPHGHAPQKLSAMRAATTAAAAAAEPLAATRSRQPESGGRPQPQLPSFPRPS